MAASASKTKSGVDRLRDVPRVTDMIHDVMHSNWPSWSIDTLLCHPYEAIKMATLVCKHAEFKATEERVNEICRIALRARKSGNLKIDRN